MPIAPKDRLIIALYVNTLEAAEERNTRPGSLQLLAVSVLTHHNDAELKTMGFEQSSTELVLSFLQNAYQTGLRGCVCSPLEAAQVRLLLEAT